MQLMTMSRSRFIAIATGAIASWAQHDPIGCELCREARDGGIEITTFDELVCLVALVLEIL